MNAFNNQYAILEKIGEGGMGTVYLAKDTMLDRWVAVKQLNNTTDVDEAMGDRFQQEALALAKLNHPNITHLYSFITKEKTFWMVMEYVEGKTLENWLHIHKKITHPLAASIAVQLLDGLQHAHKKGIIHRDIKPANVMINEDGEVKIMDFGIARMRSTRRITRHGKSVGTLEYMAPEQIHGQEGDERTDVYAVGNIMYELLCGMPPYRADTDYQIMKDKLEKDPKPIVPFNASVPVALQKIIFKALERKPEKRYRSAAELKQAIQQCMGNSLLSQSELTNVLKASQVFTTPQSGNEPMSVTALLAKAKSISGNLKVPGIKKANRPMLFLAASVLLCAILLIWSSASDSPPENDADSDISFNEAPVDTPAYAEIKQEIVTAVLGLEETPNEMYRRINKQNSVSVNANPNTKAGKKEVNDQKNISNKKTVQADDDDDDVSYNNRRTEQIPVDVPAGKTIRVTLSENLSSEDESRDGGVLRLSCAENIEANGRVIIKKGAPVTAKVVDVISSRNDRKKALVGFVIQKVQAADGSSIKLKSQRYRLFADAPGEPVGYRSGQSFTAELGRGRVR